LPPVGRSRRQRALYSGDHLLVGRECTTVLLGDERVADPDAVLAALAFDERRV
jgi:hypothetical protein